MLQEQELRDLGDEAVLNLGEVRAELRAMRVALRAQPRMLEREKSNVRELPDDHDLDSLRASRAMVEERHIKLTNAYYSLVKKVTHTT